MIELNPIELRKKGIEALNKALGPVGMARFLQQYESGCGDYTQERHNWLDNQEIDEIVKEIQKKK